MLSQNRIVANHASSFAGWSRNFFRIGRPTDGRRVGIWLFLLLIVSYAYFANGIGSGNSTTRLALSLALVQRGELTIDDLAPETIDKAQANGHFYSDKAPGMSFMAIPVVYIALPLIEHLGSPPIWFEGHRPTLQFKILQYLVEIFTSVLPMVIAVIALHEAALRLGASRGGALFAALSLGLGTPAWGWATTFFGHATSAAFQFLALAIIINLVAPGRDITPKHPLLQAAAAGALLGWTVVVELVAAPSVAMIAAYGLLRFARQTGLRQWVSLTAAAGTGALAGVMPLLVYDTLAFGSPFSVGYSHVVGFAGMNYGFHGIDIPNPRIAFAILFGEYRGLLWICPILLAVPWALFRLFQRRNQRSLLVLLLAISTYYILLNSGYYYWDGGWSTGPRHITPILPFLCLPLSLLWTDAKPATRAVLVALLGLSVGLSLICASVGMMADTSPALLWDYLIPQFTWGNWGGVLLFQLSLLPPQYSLLPLLFLWVAMGLLWNYWVAGLKRAEAVQRNGIVMQGSADRK